MEVTLIIHSVDRIWEAPVTSSRLTLGRTDAADVVISDTNLSRVHASINREGDRIWIVDEGSTNGTFVNGNPVPPSGIPLHDGDEIDLGVTSIVVSIKQSLSAEVPAAAEAQAAEPGAGGLPVPIIAAAAGIVIILFATIFVVVAFRNNNNNNNRLTVNKYQGRQNSNDGPGDPTPAPSSSEPDATPSPSATASPIVVPPKKRYLAMTPDEQRQFVADESQHVASMIGNRAGYAFPRETVTRIKAFVDTYARRVGSPKPAGGGCNMHHDLGTLLNRAHNYAPVIVRSFNEKGLSPQLGLYLAMIEAEYCSCLSSGTGPKGFFQFASSTARRYGVQDVSSPHDTRPDDRCKIDTMAPIAAQYMKDLVAMFGTGPLSVPLAIASYNEGEGGLNENLKKALDAARTANDPERSFWTLVAHDEILSTQFKNENIKYVPKFFAAAIVGENPRIFGVELAPISSYTQQQGPVAGGDANSQ